MSLQTLFLVIALVLFIVLALGVVIVPHALEWGLAAFVAGHIPFGDYIKRSA